MSGKLNRYAKNLTSQYGEDGIIQYILNNIPGPTNRWCCEFGAGDGKTFSNTHSLWRKHGWNAVLLEADGVRFAKLQERVRDATNVHILNTAIEPNGPNSLDHIFLKYGFELNIGVLSIDIDSYLK